LTKLCFAFVGDFDSINDPKSRNMVNEDKIPEASAEGPVELESQFILRLPPGPSAALRATVASGVNLKDRLTIQIEADVRHGKVRFDGWSLPAKIVDLPTIIECHKTLDKKTFYKTADICQMMICKEEVDGDVSESETTSGKTNAVGKDKKFLYPHGITAPLKNIRKKRFRKTLRKKFVDVPEIEKEVKRLFKMDAEASHVRYEIVNAEDEGRERSNVNNEGLNNNNSHSNLDIAEHDLFGEIVSSSDEEDTRAGGQGLRDDDSDDDSESAKFPTSSQKVASQAQTSMPTSFATEFTKEMLGQQDNDASNDQNMSFDMTTESTSAAEAVAALEAETEASDYQENEGLLIKLKELEQEIRDLQSKRRKQEQEVSGIENPALKSRFQSLINSYKEQENEKQRQYDDIFSILNPQ
jgi:TATA-binding protein-associated factor Taf7